MECGDKIPTMIKIKQEVDEEPESSVTGGYQVFFIKQEVEEEDFRQDGVEEDSRQGDVDEDSTQDDEVEMQVTTGSSSESVGNVTLENKDSDLGWQLSGEDGEEDEREEQSEMEVGNPSFQDNDQDSGWQRSGEDEKDQMRDPPSASFALKRPLNKTRMLRVNTEQKKVFLAKNLQFQDNKHQRNQAKYRRVKNLFKKGHELAEITDCQVFVYVKDEFSKTTFWGTSDALELFKPVMDSVVAKEDKRVRGVKFVAPSKPDEWSPGTPSTSSDGPDLEGWLELESDLPDTKTRVTQDKAKEKKVCLSKNLEFKDISFLRHQARYRRGRNIFKKGHDLAMLTNCAVFLYVKDEFRKTTYWGTSNALQLFQPTIDSLITKGDKAVQCVKFVTPSKAPKVMWSTSHTNSEALDSDDPCSGWLESVPSTQESSPESSSQLPKTIGHSAPESTSVAQDHSAQKSIPVMPPHSAPNATPEIQHHSEPVSTPPAQHHSALSTPQELEPSAARSTLCNTMTGITEVNTRSKKLCLAKSLEFKDNKNLRNQVRYRRVKNIFKKGHELAEITRCQVFLYVKDEFSNTTYWGSSDALKLFQPTIDSLVMKGDKPAQSVKFVTPSDAPEELGPSIAGRPLLNTKTGMFEVKNKPKKVCVAQNLQFKDNKHLRNQARYRRVKNLFKKGHELAELTKCRVFIFVKDEFSKTTYWGTSDALELFQPTIDSLVLKEDKLVQSVTFVTPSKEPDVKSTSLTTGEALECDDPCSGHLVSVPSKQECVPSSGCGGSPSGSSQHLTLTNDSAPEITRVPSHHAARGSSLKTPKTTPRKSTPYSLRRRRTPKFIPQDLVSIIPDP